MSECTCAVDDARVVVTCCGVFVNTGDVYAVAIQQLFRSSAVSPETGAGVLVRRPAEVPARTNGRRC